jgi:hypothetical protein
MRAMKVVVAKLSAPLMIILSLSGFTASAQGNRVTCIGVLLNVYVKPHINAQRDWPLAIIYDESGGYACTIDRSGSGHDPLRPCNAGEKCRVVGTYERKVKGDYAQTYLIGTLISVEGAGDLEK